MLEKSFLVCAKSDFKKCIIFLTCVQIAELEAQCNEANQEKQKNAQLTIRVQELEAELQDKEQVSHAGVEMTGVCRTGFMNVC